MTLPSLQLVHHLLSLTEDSVDPRLFQQAQLALLDNVGCGLFGSIQPWGKITREFALSEAAKGHATLLGSDQGLTPARVAFANGTATHGFELDDIVQGALVHPGAVVVSAALAIAEEYDVSGQRLLLGIIAGYEMMARLGLALGAQHNTQGFHTTGVAGSVASVVACAVVLKMEVDQVLSAIGIACSMSSGIKAFTQGTGGMVKRMHAGQAAESGVVACELAKRGFTGPQAGIDGRYGLLSVIGGHDIRPEALNEHLGTSFAIDHIWVKAYPCCGLLHSSAHALEALKQEHRITPDQVQEIQIHSGERAIEQNSNTNPREPMTAQYSLEFCAGVSLAKDARDPQAYAQDQLDDPGVRALLAKTRLFVDQDMESLFPAHFAARVVVKTTGGASFEKTVIDPKGTDADPLTPQEIDEKFERLARPVKTAQAIQHIKSLSKELVQSPTMKQFSAALRQGNL